MDRSRSDGRRSGVSGDDGGTGDQVPPPSTRRNGETEHQQWFFSVAPFLVAPVKSPSLPPSSPFTPVTDLPNGAGNVIGLARARSKNLCLARGRNGTSLALGRRCPSLFFARSSCRSSCWLSQPRQCPPRNPGCPRPTGGRRSSRAITRRRRRSFAKSWTEAPGTRGCTLAPHTPRWGSAAPTRPSRR